MELDWRSRGPDDESRQGWRTKHTPYRLCMIMAEDHGVVSISPSAVELCTKIMVVHELGACCVL